MFLEGEKRILNIEHKLDLVQQIHREQKENEKYIYNNLKQRKYNRGIYNTDAYDYGRYEIDYSGGQEGQVSWLASFRFRLLVAVLLFLCFFVMEKKGIKYGGIGSEEIVEYIDSNMNMDKLSAFMDKNTL